MRLITLFTIFLICSTSWSQNDSIIKGKIIVETNDTDGITILNLSNKNTTISANGGYFTIKAKIKDTLMFSAIHLEAKKHIVSAKDFKNTLLFIKLAIHTKHIKEIMITNADISAESLGLVPKGQKKYTPAERRLKTASSLDGQWGLNTFFSVDPLLNWITGRTAQLKKELEIERKEFLQIKINTTFEKEYLTGVLKIPSEYTDGFVFYIVEDKELVEAIKIKNKTKVAFRLSELATEYLKLKEPEIKTGEEIKTANEPKKNE